MVCTTKIKFQDIWRFRRDLLEWWQRSGPLTFHPEYLKINSRSPDPQIRAVSIMICRDSESMLYMWRAQILFQPGQHDNLWAFSVTLTPTHCTWHEQPLDLLMPQRQCVLMKDVWMVNLGIWSYCFLTAPVPFALAVLSLCRMLFHQTCLIPLFHLLLRETIPNLFIKCGISPLLSLPIPLFWIVFITIWQYIVYCLHDNMTNVSPTKAETLCWISQILI